MRCVSFVFSLVNHVLENTKARISRDNNRIPGLNSNIEEFELFDGLKTTDETERELQKINIKNIKQYNLENNSQETFLKKIEDSINNLAAMRNSLTNISALVANNDEELYKQVNNSFDHLTKEGIRVITQLYEMLGLSKEAKYSYKVSDILAQCKEAEKLYHPNDTIGKQYRQIKFTLADDDGIGKKIYDAWLNDLNNESKENGHLSMLRISPEEVQKFGIDFMELSNKLNFCKSKLEELKKAINNR
jgi:hypothetical protein